MRCYLNEVLSRTDLDRKMEQHAIEVLLKREEKSKGKKEDKNNKDNEKSQ